MFMEPIEKNVKQIQTGIVLINKVMKKPDDYFISGYQCQQKSKGIEQEGITTLWTH